ncbi:MAG: nucleotidyltransferase domain-containing protein [Arthrospira sp. SH-MAG29]|nr:nucleotidyltransferase domain-containing protein [Arthrospira sp. SH-MAG29]MBS0018623.1 nucleotidyltransferase domain-containing protein [Arthrospira sp. SH-MAG29]
MQNPNLPLVIQRVKEGLMNYYQDQIESIILYGSQARGDAKEYSDIDFLILLKSLDNPFDEIDKTTNLITDICLDYDVVISWQFIASERFKIQDYPFIYNVKKEGLFV